MIQYIAYGVAGIALAGGGAWAGARYAKNKFEDSPVEELEGIEHGSGFRMADTARNAEGAFASAVKSFADRRDKQKALSKGFVRWHLVGSNFSEPMYVKPEPDEGNVPTLEYEGGRYMFPPDASVPAQEEGVPVVVHRMNEAEPINLADSWEESVSASALEEYLTLSVTSDPPEGGSGGLLGSGMLAGMDSMDIMRLGIIAIVVFFVLMEVLG
jgi:hypothetical protein